ncbi:MAG: class I poly(R)-hydroxyalkanoic acid synthase, partial [Burkholderiales bacterium]|nr:class I poly(R)-hydroxyalkanoic acid synthase [Burkholderiales bacterium]
MTENTQALWAQSAQQFQDALADNWAKTFQSFQNMDLGGLAAGLPTSPASAPNVHLSQDKLQALQEQYLKDASALWTNSLQGTAPPKDKRFAAQAWSANPVAAFSASAYLLNARTLMGMAEAVEGDAKTRARIRFAVEQWMAASAPSNFLAF